MHGDIYEDGAKIIVSSEEMPDIPKYRFTIEALTGTRNSAPKEVLHEADNQDVIPYKKTDAELSFLPEKPLQEEPNYTEVLPEDEYPASHVFVTVLVTDASGNQAEVSINGQDQSVVIINSIYKGVDSDPNGRG